MRSVTDFIFIVSIMIPLAAAAAEHEEIVHTTAEGTFMDETREKTCSLTLIGEQVSKSFALVSSNQNTWRLVREGQDGSRSDRSLEERTITIGPMIQAGVDFRIVRCRLIHMYQKTDGGFYAEAETTVVFEERFRQRMLKLGRQFDRCVDATEPYLDCVNAFSAIPAMVKSSWVTTWRSGVVKGSTCFEKECGGLKPGQIYVHRDLIAIGGDEMTDLVIARAREFLGQREKPLTFSVVPWANALRPNEFRVVPPIELMGAVEGLPEVVVLASGRNVTGKTLYLFNPPSFTDPCLAGTRFLEAWELNGDTLIQVRVDLAATFRLERVYLMPGAPLMKDEKVVGRFDAATVALYKCPDGKRLLSTVHGVVKAK